MPRTVSSRSCLTCRKRKLKCDEEFPVCSRCIKAGLHCDRTSRTKFKTFSGPRSKEEENKPRSLLKDPHIADLFHIYIKDLAPWYDLNDETHAFERDGAVKALDSPLLFSAIIAFAAIYAARTQSSNSVIAEEYHAKCLRLLIKLSVEDEEVRCGTALAATCLLRSYEILSEVEDPNRHLFGASTLLPQAPPLVGDYSLLASGFWNYLREDITYSLIHDCQLKIVIKKHIDIPASDNGFANAMTLFLARAINVRFGRTNDASDLQILSDDFVARWQAFKPQPFASFDANLHVFPTIKMLADTHVAALHYYLVVQCILTEQDLDELAAEICGSAMSSRSPAVIVNAYGPVCFAGRWLTSPSQRNALVRWLRETERKTAWSTKAIVNKLQAAWTVQVRDHGLDTFSKADPVV